MKITIKLYTAIYVTDVSFFIYTVHSKPPSY